MAYRHPIRLLACTLLAAVAGCAAPTDRERLAALVGQPSAQAGARLAETGYAPAGRDGAAALWRNPRNGLCARVAAAGGRVVSVTAVPAERC